MEEDYREIGIMKAIGIPQKNIQRIYFIKYIVLSVIATFFGYITILFGDEPTGALNSRFANEIMEILAEINRKNTTILLVTHDVHVASRTERVLYMRDGNIAGEVYLGKLSPEKQGLVKREEKLKHWLNNMGF